jgi:hypothetical protein
MNDKNWTVYQADFVDILQNSGKCISHLSTTILREKVGVKFTL